MKKFLLILILSISLPVNALCPIDSNENTVCSLTDFNQQNKSIFQDKNTETNFQNQQVNTSPFNKINPIENRKNSNMDLNYNSGCQFGNCVQDLNNTYNKNQ